MCVCIYPSPNVWPILFHELPGGPRRGSLIRLHVYLKLFLVYLMTGCLSEEQGGSANYVRRTLMCVFRRENSEVVITIAADTVIRKFLLPSERDIKVHPLICW